MTGTSFKTHQNNHTKYNRENVSSSFEELPQKERIIISSVGCDNSSGSLLATTISTLPSLITTAALHNNQPAPVPLLSTYLSSSSFGNLHWPTQPATPGSVGSSASIGGAGFPNGLLGRSTNLTGSSAALGGSSSIVSGNFLNYV